MCGIACVIVAQWKRKHNSDGNCCQTQQAQATLDVACRRLEPLKPLLVRRGPDSAQTHTILVDTTNTPAHEGVNNNNNNNNNNTTTNNTTNTTTTTTTTNNNNNLADESHVRCCDVAMSMFATVLHLRGPLTPQPVVDTNGNALAWNGEAYSGVDNLDLSSNDTVAVLAALANATNDNNLVETIERIRGPWALIYWQKDLRRLWIGRDYFGRRSLLWRWSECHLELSSVASSATSSTHTSHVAIGVDGGVDGGNGGVDGGINGGVNRGVDGGVSDGVGVDAGADVGVDADTGAAWEEVPATGVFYIDFARLQPTTTRESESETPKNTTGNQNQNRNEQENENKNEHENEINNEHEKEWEKATKRDTDADIETEIETKIKPDGETTEMNVSTGKKNDTESRSNQHDDVMCLRDLLTHIPWSDTAADDVDDVSVSTTLVLQSPVGLFNTTAPVVTPPLSSSLLLLSSSSSLSSSPSSSRKTNEGNNNGDKIGDNDRNNNNNNSNNTNNNNNNNNSDENNNNSTTTSTNNNNTTTTTSNHNKNHDNTVTHNSNSKNKRNNDDLVKEMLEKFEDAVRRRVCWQVEEPVLLNQPSGSTISNNAPTQLSPSTTVTAIASTPTPTPAITTPASPTTTIPGTTITVTMPTATTTTAITTATTTSTSSSSSSTLPSSSSSSSVNTTTTNAGPTTPRVGILFSGGIDSMMVAAVADRVLPLDVPIDLFNVAFENPHFARHGRDPYSVPDRVTGEDGVAELRGLSKRRWRWIPVNVSLAQLIEYRGHVRELVHPLASVMDESIACAIWFAARGSEEIEVPNIEGNGAEPLGQAKVLLLGMGADEQLAGYGRHRTRFERGGWDALIEEVQMDIRRISYRNLGRDDRCISDHGLEARFPFLDEDFVTFLNKIPMQDKVDFTLPRGFGEKKLLRDCARSIGLQGSADLPKRAIQFGSRIAKIDGAKSKGSDKMTRR